uniref:Insulinase family protein n=1 Tax=candidate division WOR-3 bacterium TaxID=2052148 RepID=A0A7V0Z3F2_UNCW3
MKKHICFFIVFIFLVDLAFAINIERDTLENGLVMLLSEAHKIPMVELKLIVKSGSVYDPPGKEGIANLCAKMLLRGTELHKGDELIEKIEYLGANIDVHTREDYIEISGRALSKDLSILLEIVAECLKTPSFDSIEFKKLQRQTYSEIISQLDDPFYAGEVAFRNLLFQTHPLNHDPLGFDSTITKININDLRNFYNLYYAPNNSAIIIVGDFNKDSVKMEIGKYFSNWNRKRIPEFSIQLPELIGKKGMIIKRKISQSYIFFGFFGPDNKASDWLPARLMNYILGGSGLTSRLATEIREKRGFAYSVYSFFDRYNFGGYFVAGVQTKNESANESIDLIIKEVKRITDGVSADELELAKKYYIGNFPLNFDTYREMTNFIVKIELEGLGLDYPDKFEQMIKNITINDIKGSALKYLKPDDFCLVVVGDISAEMIKIEGIEWIK